MNIDGFIYQTNPGTPITVLIVDDEPVFRNNIAKLLKGRGFEVDQAESGAECLDIIRKKPADVIVLDVKMPGINGIETLRKIQKMHLKPEVILITGEASAKDGVEGIKTGAFDYLSKPVEIDHLISKILQARDKVRLEDEHRRETEFRARMEKQMAATERLASLGTLATGMAHEINNPLAIIKQSAKLMRLLLEHKDQSDMPDEPNFNKALTNIEKAVDRAKRITHQLLSFVGKNDSVVTEVDICKLIADALQIIQGVVEDKKIEIVLEIASNLQPVFTDPYKLRQVMTNLLINAAQATDSGGRIIIILETTGEDIVLRVQDNGGGIPKENLEKIYEPFFSTKSPGDGTGLGLYVTRGIIEGLNGAIFVESQMGQGARFTVKLPRHCTANNRS